MSGASPRALTWRQAPYRFPPLRNALLSGVLLGVVLLFEALDVDEAVPTAVFLVAVAVGARYFGEEGIRELFSEREVGIEILMMLAALGAVVHRAFDAKRLDPSGDPYVDCVVAGRSGGMGRALVSILNPALAVGGPAHEAMGSAPVRRPAVCPLSPGEPGDRRPEPCRPPGPAAIIGHLDARDAAITGPGDAGHPDGLAHARLQRGVDSGLRSDRAHV